MLKLFNNNRPQLLFFTPLLALFFVLPVFILQRNEFVIQTVPFSALAFIQPFTLSPYMFGLLAILGISINAVFQQQLSSAHSLLPSSTHITLPVYVLLSTLLPLHAMSLPGLLLTFLTLLIFFRLFSTYQQEKPYSALFDSGLLCGIASLFYAPAFFLLVFIWLASFFLKPFTWRDIVIPFVGFLLPIFLTIAFLFISRNNAGIEQVLVQTTSISELLRAYWISPLIFTLLLAAFFFYYLFMQNRKGVQLRSMYAVFMLFLALALLSALFPGSHTAITYQLAILPCSFFIADLFQFMDGKKWPINFIYLILLFAYILNHYYMPPVY